MEFYRNSMQQPASELSRHNLVGLLDAALRATSSINIPADVLRRLDVHLLEISPGDAGWDVFSFTYNVDGPLGTIMTQEARLQYLQGIFCLFPGSYFFDHPFPFSFCSLQYAVAHQAHGEHFIVALGARRHRRTRDQVDS
jgi:hypothetical protein